MSIIIINTFNDLYSCPIEIIKGLTDIKGTVSVSHWSKGALIGNLPVYNTISFTKLIYQYFIRKYLNPSWTTLLPMLGSHSHLIKISL